MGYVNQGFLYGTWLISFLLTHNLLTSSASGKLEWVMFTGLALVIEYAKYVTFLEAYRSYKAESQIEMRAFGGMFVALLTISLSASVSSMSSSLSVNGNAATAQYRSDLNTYDVRIQYADSDIASAQGQVTSRRSATQNIQKLIDNNNEMIARYISRTEFQTRAVPLQQENTKFLTNLSDAEKALSEAQAELRKAQDAQLVIVAEKAALARPEQDILSSAALQLQEVAGIQATSTTLLLTALIAAIFEAGLLVFGYLKARTEPVTTRPTFKPEVRYEREVAPEPQSEISFQARELASLKKHADTAFSVIEGSIPAGPSGMSKVMGIGRGTAQEIVKVLSAFGIVEKDENGHYQPVMPRDQLELLLAV